MTESQTVFPVPSATVIIGRDIPDDYEVFMIVRHQKSAFAGGALVFPGGKVDESDYYPGIEDRCQGLEDLTKAEISIRVAAIRETYEECGILLARALGESNLVSVERLSTFKAYRQKLADNEITIQQFLEKEDLTLAFDRLTLFAHWITPEMSPKRYDTLFFLTKAPREQVGQHDGTETVDSVWLSPTKVLEEHYAEKRTVMFPTRMNVEKLGRCKSVEELIEKTKAGRVVTVLPWVENRDDGQFLCIQPEADYDRTEESLATVWHPM
jgi:8-oxo-dGTP pyrophosphatase MutT (NUDIX family)